jgi:chromate transporter
VAQAAVTQHGWLSAPQMIDGLALGETTPGPLIMVVAFVAFVGGWTHPMFGANAIALAAVVSACVATFFTFLPSFVFILAGGPLVEATHGQLGFTAPLVAVTAAVVGVIVNLSVFFAQHVLWPDGFGGAFSWASALIGLASAVALMRFGVSVTRVIGACALIGLARALMG